MFIVVTGNVDAIKTINIIKNNQTKKKFNKVKVEVKKIIEPDKVFKKKEIRYYDVDVPCLIIFATTCQLSFARKATVDIISLPMARSIRR